MLVRDADAKVGRVAAVEGNLVIVEYGDGPDRIWNDHFLVQVPN